MLVLLLVFLCPAKSKTGVPYCSLAYSSSCVGVFNSLLGVLGPCRQGPKQRREKLNKRATPKMSHKSCDNRYIKSVGEITSKIWPVV